VADGDYILAGWTLAETGHNRDCMGNIKNITELIEFGDCYYDVK
jgi:hypothetical protein